MSNLVTWGTIRPQPYPKKSLYIGKVGRRTADRGPCEEVLAETLPQTSAGQACADAKHLANLIFLQEVTA